MPAKASAFTFVLEEYERQTPVEQWTPGGATQPDPALWVVNPTGCIWDPDDDELWHGNGDLAPGATTSKSVCIVGDNIAHGVFIQMISRSPNLVVTLRLGPHTFNVTPVPSGRDYRYNGCFAGPDYDAQSPALVPIEGSNGGKGVLGWEASVEIRNPTSKVVRDVGASFRVHIDSGVCRGVLISTAPRIWRSV